MIHVKRVYEPPAPAEGARWLVDRLWPRGLRRDDLRLDGWAREAAPSDALRQWYGHDPDKWEEFRRRYAAELDAHPEAWQPLLLAARQGDVSLLFSSRELERNNAHALQEYLERRLAEEPAVQAP